MALTFSDDWVDEIADVTGAVEFQNATITITDPSDVSPDDYDPITGIWTTDPNTAVYSGQARIAILRWGVNNLGTQVANGTTQTAVQVQVPQLAVGRMKKGLKMRVDACAKNPSLTEYTFTSTSDLQGSNAATRTFEFVAEGDSQ